MSFITDFADFIDIYNIETVSFTRVDGRAIPTTTEDTINAIVQPYSETSLNSNTIQRDRKLEGKDIKGTVLIISDSNLDLGVNKTFIYINGQKYEIDQKMSYNKIYQHYEYLASLVKAS